MLCHNLKNHIYQFWNDVIYGQPLIKVFKVYWSGGTPTPLKKQAQKLGKDASENLNILNKAYKIEWKLQEVNKNLLKS